MSLKMPAIFLISCLLATVLQFIAALDGIMHFFGLHWIFAIFVAGLLALIPAIGPLAGIYGAVQAWGWPVWAAVLLFFWPYLLYAGLLYSGQKASFWFWKQMFASERRPARSDIEPDYVVKEQSGHPEEIIYIEHNKDL